MFARLLAGLCAFSAAVTGFVSLLAFNLLPGFVRYPVPMKAQLLAIAFTIIGGTVATLYLVPITRKYPRIRFVIHIKSKR